MVEEDKKQCHWVKEFLKLAQIHMLKIFKINNVGVFCTSSYSVFCDLMLEHISEI